MLDTASGPLAGFRVMTSLTADPAGVDHFDGCEMR
jgi:hypothetical protein